MSWNLNMAFTLSQGNVLNALNTSNETAHNNPPCPLLRHRRMGSVFGSASTTPHDPRTQSTQYPPWIGVNRESPFRRGREGRRDIELNVGTIPSQIHVNCAPVQKRQFHCSQPIFRDLTSGICGESGPGRRFGVKVVSH